MRIKMARMSPFESSTNDEVLISTILEPVKGGELEKYASTISFCIFSASLAWSANLAMDSSMGRPK